MTTTYHQTEHGQQGIRRRATSKGLNFGPIATAITITVVAVLLGVTFIGDWLRTPSLSAELSPGLISPNGDNVQDVATLSYTLDEDADVVVQVVDAAGNVIQTILPETFQTRGQHVTAWDGLDYMGQVVPDGQYQLTVTGKGTVRASQESASVVVDTVPPMLQVANLDEAQRVRESDFTLEGITDADAVVQLASDAQVVPVDANGQFSLKRQLAEGVNSIQLIATDPAGNMTTFSREVSLITRPPEVTLSNGLNDMWTNENMIAVSGAVPAGIALKVNGHPATVNEAGKFQHEVILQEGQNSIKLEATDDVGNITTQEFSVHRKTIPPELTVNVEDGTSFQQSEIQVLGKTEPGATVLIGGQAVSVSPIGEFQTTVQLAPGENLLEVMAQDQAGNLTKRQKRLNFEVLSPQPEWARVMNNLPTLGDYLLPAMIALPSLLILAYFFTRPVSLVLSAESAAFRPGLPEEGRFLRLMIDLSKPARTTVDVKDRRGNTVSTLQYKRHRTSGQQTLYWNGYDDFGRVVPPGQYTIYATAATTGGTVTSMLNISVQEDSELHYQYLRNTPQDKQEAGSQRNYFRQRTSSVQKVGRSSK